MVEASDHEEALIRAFFVPTKRARYLEMIAKPKKRENFLCELSHFKSLDSRYCLALPKGIHNPEQISRVSHSEGCATDVLGYF